MGVDVLSKINLTQPASRAGPRAWLSSKKDKVSVMYFIVSDILPSVEPLFAADTLEKLSKNVQCVITFHPSTQGTSLVNAVA